MNLKVVAVCATVFMILALVASFIESIFISDDNIQLIAGFVTGMILALISIVLYCYLEDRL